MKKSIILAISAIATLGFLSTGNALPLKSNITPFTDHLLIHFKNFPANMNLMASYKDDNGIMISGPAVINSVGDVLVTLHSNNKYQQGTPEMMLRYATTEGVAVCGLDFVDGPWTMLNFETGKAPACPAVTIGGIQQSGLNAYTMTITGN